MELTANCSDQSYDNLASFFFDYRTAGVFTDIHRDPIAGNEGDFEVLTGWGRVSM